LKIKFFKGLALGAPHIKAIGIGRAAMAAAMVGETVGKMIKKVLSRLTFLNSDKQFPKYSVDFRNSEQGLVMR